jgi:hypothetical protein
MMDKLPMRSQGTPNEQAQIALEREHKKRLAKLREAKAKPNDDEEQDNGQ